MHYKEHCKECLEKLGKDWSVVHIWLDERAKETWPWMGHRMFRHHIVGVEEVRHKWGDEAAKAAELHIIADEGKVPKEQAIRDKYCKEHPMGGYMI